MVPQEARRGCWEGHCSSDPRILELPSLWYTLPGEELDVKRSWPECMKQVMSTVGGRARGVELPMASGAQNFVKGCQLSY